jgi:cholest-4-en-3-one 26-monooxygenase
MTSTTAAASDPRAEPIDLTDPALYAAGNPHEVFRELRARRPVHWHGPVDLPSNMEGGAARSDGFWAVLGHPEITEINRDWERFRAADGPTLVAFPPEMRGTALIWMDPPDHTRLRKLVSSGFTPRMLRRLDELLVRRADRILDAVAEYGEFNFVSEVAYQLPMHVIADIVGIPEDERPYVFGLTDRMLKGLDRASDITVEQGIQARADLFAYAEKLSARKEREPADDVWTELTTASLTTDDGAETRLAKLELDFFFVILAIAGSETTRNAIAQGLLALLENPGQLAELQADPGLLDTAVDEIIRWASPVLYFGRTAQVDAEIGGAQIRAGDRVTLWYPAGNRDERSFDDPYRFDIRRSPNPHVSFGGGGAHYCLGANLAKREVHVMMRALLTRFAGVELAGPPVWGGAGAAVNVGVALNELPVRLQPMNGRR